MTSDDNRRPNRGQFQKGRSGNPGGRPRQAQSQSNSAFDIIIDRMLIISRDGTPGEITVEEALQQRTYQEALADKRMAIREVLRWIVKREQWLARNRPAVRAKVTFTGIGQDPDNADEALLLLGIARENPDRIEFKSNRLQLQLETWAVRAALRRRRGVHTLKKSEIADIRHCTHDDGTLKLPEGIEE